MGNFNKRFVLAICLLIFSFLLSSCSLESQKGTNSKKNSTSFSQGLADSRNVASATTSQTETNVVDSNFDDAFSLGEFFEFSEFTDETPVESPSVVVDSPAVLPAHEFNGKLGLLQIIDEKNPQIYSLQANTGFKTVYKNTLSVSAGDLLRLRGQVELTNDTTTPIAGVVRILVNGNQVSQSYFENVIVDQVHHLPYWADTVFSVAATGSAVVELQIEAQRSDSSPSLTVESSGYGHLVIEQYRPLTEDNFRSLKGIVNSLSTKSVLVSSYGGQAFYLYTVLSTGANALTGDLFRIVGQTISVYSSYDMHGTALWANGIQISPWSTQDHVWNTAYNPNYVDGVFTAPSNGNIDFTATMHTSLGTWNPVGSGHILGLQYRSATDNNFDQLSYLKKSYITTIPTAFTLQANAGWYNVQSEIVTLKKGDILKIRGQKQFVYPAAAVNPIFCQSQVIVNSGSTSYSASTSSYKYMNNQMGGMPLNNDDIFVAPSDNSYAIYSQAFCNAQKSGYVSISNAALVIDIFGK